MTSKKFTTLIAKSKKEFLKEYKKYDLEEMKSLHNKVICELEPTITKGDLDLCKKLTNILSIIEENTLKPSGRNLLDEANLVILSCKYNQALILEHVLNFIKDKSNISPGDVDEFSHNAFYYAIRSNNIQLLSTLIDQWPGNLFTEKKQLLDDLLSEAYEDLKLKNVPLTDAMEFSVESRLMNLRFFSEDKRCYQFLKVNIKTLNQRIELVSENIQLLVIEYRDSDKIDEKFIFVAKFIARNIHVLKKQMKSTYNELPWEEIEFCLVKFIHSYTEQKEINLFTRVALDRKKVLTYLQTFAKHLENEMVRINETGSIEGLTRIPVTKREQVITHISSKCPQFEDLYDDFHTLRDIHSLQKVDDYIKLALSANPSKKEGQLTITRVLQVIGEHFKNTLESPKLSANTSEHLLLCLPKNTRDVVRDLRNSLSHSYALSERTDIFERANKGFFKGIQSDTKKIGDGVADLLYSRKINIVRCLMKRVVEEDTFEELAAIVEIFGNAKLDFSPPINFVSSDYTKLKKSTKELRDSIIEKTSSEEYFLNQIDDILKRLNCEQADQSARFQKGFQYLSLFQNFFENYKEEHKRSIKTVVKKLLQDTAPEVGSGDMKKIARFALKIFNSVMSRGQTEMMDEVTRVIWDIFHLTEVGTVDIKLIQELRDTLSESQHFARFNNPQTTEDLEKSLLVQNMTNFKDALKRNDFIDSLKSISSYKQNKKLQAAVEMLVLDIMSILSTSRDCLENNMFFVDSTIPLLMGKSLRNHLAHDNSLIDLLLPDPAVAVFLNVKKLCSKNLDISQKKLGQFVRDEPSNFEYKYKSNLIKVLNQKALFEALQKGQNEDVYELLRKGADMNATSFDLGWTCLHFASKGPSIECVKAVLDNKININEKDVNGLTALHVAAKYGRADIVQLLLHRFQECINVKDKFERTSLHYAAQNGHSNVVEVLLNKKANFRLLDCAGHGALHYAIQNKNVGTAKLLFQEGDFETLGGFTSLHHAAEFGCLEIITFLLESGANVNSKNDMDYTPLHTAAFNGHTDVVNILIAKGAEVNTAFINGCTPLHYAIECGHEEIAKKLISAGADVNAVEKTYQSSPLHYAAALGFNKIMIFLLQNKADISAVDLRGTPLHSAANCGHYACAEVLLQWNADRGVMNYMGATPLDLAVYNGHTKIVKLLLEPPTTNSHRDWLLHMFKSRIHCSKLLNDATLSGHEDIVKMLLNQADVNQTFLNRTPLHSAALSGNGNIIELFLKYNADVNARSFTNETPLHEAVTSGNIDAVKILLYNNADINANAFRGQPIHYAFGKGELETISLLLKHGADINAKDPEGKTPLYLAVAMNKTKVVQYLIAAGANVNVSVKNKTTLLLAVLNNNIDIVELLLQSGVKTDTLSNFDLDMNNPLVVSISSGNRKLTEILLKFDINVNSPLPKQATLLHLAAQQGNIDTVNALIAKGAHIDTMVDGMTPLCLVAKNGYKDIVELLIKNCANVNGKSGTRPLHLAISHGFCDIVDFLLEKGASVNLHDENNNTAIDIAIACGNLAILKVLLNKQTKNNANVSNPDNDSPLHLSSKGSNISLLKFLADQGYDINVKNNFGLKPMHIAAKEGFKEAVEFYISKGMDINDPDSMNRTSLHYASMLSDAKHLETLKYLIDQGCLVNIKDDEGKTPLHLAAMHGTTDSVKLLIKNNADYIAMDNNDRKPVDVAKDESIVTLLKSIENLFEAVRNRNASDVEKHIRAGALVDSKRSDNGTVLHHAAWKGFDNIVKVLLENEANPNALGKNKMTPLHYAAKFSHYKVLLMLLSNGAIYDAHSVEGKTPADLCTDSKISSILKLISDSFKQVFDNNSRLVQNLNKLKQIEIVKAVMGACNKENDTLITSAILNKYLKVEDLKCIYQDDINLQLLQAEFMGDKGNYAQALDLFKSLYERRLNVLGPNNPATLDIEECMARMLYGMGSLHDAFRNTDNVFEKRAKYLGENSPQTLSSGHKKALFLHRLGRNEESLALFREVYRKQSEVLGPGASDTEDTLFDMALVLREHKSYDEALEIYQTAYERRRKTAGNDSVRTILAQNNIAMVLADQDKLEEALTLYTSVLEKKQRVMGKKHLSTLRTLDNIPAVLTKMGKHDEALKKYKENYELKKIVLGPHHPETLQNKFCVGQTYFYQGKYISALKAFREMNDMAKAMLGPNNSMSQNIESYLKVINTIFSFRETSISEVLEHLQKDISVAAKEGNLPALKVLVTKGADVNDQDIEGRPPLHFAITSRNVEMVKYIVEHGGDVTLRTNKGNTALHTATNNKSSDELVVFILENVKKNQMKEFINARTTGSGTTALHLAAKNNSTGLVKSLLKYGAVYNIRNNENKKPVELTTDIGIRNIFSLIEDIFSHSRYGNDELVKKLEQAEKSIVPALTNARNADDKTVLQVAIAKGHKNLVILTLNIIKKSTNK